jgi:hypothetical protein
LAAIVQHMESASVRRDCNRAASAQIKHRPDHHGACGHDDEVATVAVCDRE